jgi:serine/threonine-protein kinase
MSTLPTQPPADDAERRLAQAVDELDRQRRQGHEPDVTAILRQQPDLAGELPQLWATMQVAAAFGPSVRSPDAQPTVVKDDKPLEAQAAGSSAPPRILGDYELLEELGRGGMGIVYKAWQRSLARVVAVKMIVKGSLATDEDVARFRAEAEAAARLHHPNIVAIYEVGEQDGQAFFSMEYVKGCTLAALTAVGPLPPGEAAHFLIPICRAVHHAHQHGVLHRDLKPTNVLLQSTIPKITDFGLAKRIDGAAGTLTAARLTQSGAILGTPSYMAPEQAIGSRAAGAAGLSPATDIYSLGAILYEMLTGRPPFQTASPIDTLLLVLEQDPVPPRMLNPAVDRELEMICLKCLQKPADLRYRSAAELADDLEAFQKGEVTSARPSGLAFFVSRMLRDTHHAAVLENWGLLWMWHSLALLVLCSLTNTFYLADLTSPWPYLGLWVVGLGTWAAIFWTLRRRGGPVTFVERQIAHVWAASTLGSIGLFLVEMLLDLKVLTLSPVLGLFSGMVFLVKAGTLSGSFYFWAAASFLTSLLMARFPSVGLFLFGLVAALGFFLPGLKYYRQQRAGQRTPV